MTEGRAIVGDCELPLLSDLKASIGGGGEDWAGWLLRTFFAGGPLDEMTCTSLLLLSF